MGFLANIRTIKRLASTDMNAHIGDIAVLKMDGVSMSARPEHQVALDRMAGFESVVDLDALERLPPESFGYAVARFMKDNDLSPLVLTSEVGPEMRKRNVYGIRVSQTHDLIHVLTGFDTSWPGEMGVYAVQVAQRWSSWSPLLGLSTWLFYPFLSFGRIGALRAAWRKGKQLGEQAPFLLAEPLEEMFELPLTEARERLGLQSVD